MSSSYSSGFKSGKLKLKGNKTLFKTDKNKQKQKNNLKVEVDEDALERGGWRRIADEIDLRGGIDVAFECGDFSRCYLSAQDNGKFITGAKHFVLGEPPNAEEVLTLIKTPDDPKMRKNTSSHFSLKTGFGKYVGVDPEGNLIAIADAIGSRERFEVIFQDGKCAIQSASSGLFLNLSPSTIDGYVQVSSKTVNVNEIVNIRTNVLKQGPSDYRASEDFKEAADCEATYTKMYQHSKVDLKNKLINYNVSDKTAVRRAQKDGKLHETLLDRRAKLKSDKYC